MKSLLGKTGVWLVGAAIILLAPIVYDSGFALSIMGQMGVAIIFALAYNMLLGQGGMLSFGHAVYFGLAGYFTIHYMTLMGDEVVGYFPVSLLPLFGGVVGLFFGALIGFVSTRRAGTTFAMISLGFSEMATALTLILVSFFNGEEGIQSDRWIGPEPVALDQRPHDSHDQRCDDQRRPEAHIFADLIGEVGAQHEKAGVGEIEDAHHAEDQRQPARQHEQQHAVEEPVEQGEHQDFQDDLLPALAGPRPE